MDYKKKYSNALAMDGSEPVTITKGDFDFLVALDGLIEHKVEIKVKEYIKTIWLNDLIDRVIELEEFKTNTLKDKHLKKKD